MDSRCPGLFIGPDNYLSSPQHGRYVQKRARTHPCSNTGSRQFCSIQFSGELDSRSKYQQTVAARRKSQRIESRNLPRDSSTRRKEITSTVPSHIVSSRRPSRSSFSRPRQYSRSKPKNPSGVLGLKRSKSNCALPIIINNDVQIKNENEIPDPSKMFSKNQLGDGSCPPSLLSQETLDILRRNSRHNSNCQGCQNYQKLLVGASEIISNRDACIETQRKELDFFASFNVELKNLLKQSSEEPTITLEADVQICNICGGIINNTSESDNPPDVDLNKIVNTDARDSIPPAPLLNASEIKIEKEQGELKLVIQKDSTDSMKHYLQGRRIRKLEKQRISPIAFDSSSDDDRHITRLELPEENVTPNFFQFPFENQQIDYQPRMLTNSEIKKEVVSLRIALAARQSLLNELQNRIKKANRILNHRFAALTSVPDLAISPAQFQEILGSHRKFVRWLNKFTIRGVEDIFKFEQLNIMPRSEDREVNYYIETNVLIDGVQTSGVFIPIPLNGRPDIASVPTTTVLPSGAAVVETADNKMKSEFVEFKITPEVLPEGRADIDKISNDLRNRIAEVKFHVQTSVAKCLSDFTSKEVTDFGIPIANIQNTTNMTNSNSTALVTSIKPQIDLVLDLNANPKTNPNLLPDSMVASNIRAMPTNEKESNFADFESNECYDNCQTNSLVETHKCFKEAVQNCVNLQGFVPTAVVNWNLVNSRVRDFEKVILNSPTVKASRLTQNLSPRSMCAARFPPFSMNTESDNSEELVTEEIYRRLPCIKDKIPSTLELDTPTPPIVDMGTNLAQLNIFPPSKTELNRSSKARAAVTEEDLKRSDNIKNMMREYKNEILKSEYASSDNGTNSEDENPHCLKSVSNLQTLVEYPMHFYTDLMKSMEIENEENHKSFIRSQASRRFNESTHESSVENTLLGIHTEKFSEDLLAVNDCKESMTFVKVNPFLPAFRDRPARRLDRISDVDFLNVSTILNQFELVRAREKDINVRKTSHKFQDEKLEQLHDAFELNDIVGSFYNILNPLMEEVEKETCEEAGTAGDLLKEEVELLRKQLSKTSVTNQTEPANSVELSLRNCLPYKQTKIPTPNFKVSSSSRSRPTPKFQEMIQESPKNMPMSIVKELPGPIKCHENSNFQDANVTEQLQTGEKLVTNVGYANANKRQILQSPRCNATFDVNPVPHVKPISTPALASPRVNPNPLNPNPFFLGYTTEYGAAYNRFGWKHDNGKQ